MIQSEGCRVGAIMQALAGHWKGDEQGRALSTAGPELKEITKPPLQAFGTVKCQMQAKALVQRGHITPS